MSFRECPKCEQIAVNVKTEKCEFCEEKRFKSQRKYDIMKEN